MPGNSKPISRPWWNRPACAAAFIVAGDPPEPQGPFFDSSALIATGAFERAGITAIGIGGHPDGHPNMSEAECWAVLEKKVAEISARGMAPLIVTQFGFDADRSLDWLERLRARGIDAPVRIGVPGPAGIKRLLSFAARCGVGASASVMKKYGISLGNLLGSAGPDKLVDAFASGLGPQRPRAPAFLSVRGLRKTVEWIEDHRRRHPA
jgi:methylenetetrahydrofolate reductase (NADPH)